MRQLITALGFALVATHAAAVSLSDISNTDASQGLKEALTQGAEHAVSKLGAAGGFLNNSKVKIPLPDTMKKAEKAMRMFGMGAQADELVLKMNQAAEAAVPEAKELLVNSVKQMSVQDAKDILTGGQDSATQYFRKTTSGPMAEKFLPIVKKATENVNLAQQYNKFADMGSKYGLVGKDQASLEQYVTQKTLDGVYLMMAEEEKAIRSDPMGQASSLLKTVFGAVK
ncbi:Protein of unknown function [Methylobacillus rhizosphaerae]|uniref:DUF4197 domain-containing protein n=1 Tax=Methylobacillus rhizosphaerae TaxID=551994 RepID=A0A238YZN7_9PROT|nr:DUF4197 domain-containing protein [Methylobacillus rhizosphaerae]SNR76114.1 Protein of unknown function [Methylobacillus rhizosphaerae]